ncbi:MAG: LacI family DNA-binding transcriptional regulator [Armatimonadota bacterium]|nr:LacI family DNA-binding transcriptional regulator [Armatimonadota bacterium]MDR7519878.1 LacI family DNA-binding transcriptional regulator [Armatimonadota bacterium]MDR7550536.1 LacI family DNA-binding transcriptional regulator [Armatimonadota bacterium]
MTATIREVARAAGVSVATVSRVVSGSAHRVSDPTRHRVLAAVARLGYHPNLVARGLKKRVTGTIGLIVPDISNPFFPAIARGIEDVASRAGLAVLLCNTYEDLAKERTYLGVLRKRMVDGLIFATVGANTGHLRMLRRQGVPVVLVARAPDGVEMDAVLVDNRRGAREATEHLLRLGHRRIAFIGGPATLPVARERLAGYCDALQAVGIPVDPARIGHGDFHADGGAAVVAALLRRGAAFTAVVAANDLMAIGAMRELRRWGRRLPDDVAVVGFDDITFASLVDPRLTTVAQPKYRMGCLAMERMLELLGGADRTPRRLVLEPRLIVRDSCGASRGRAPVGRVTAGAGRRRHPVS